MSNGNQSVVSWATGRATGMTPEQWSASLPTVSQVAVGAQLDVRQTNGFVEAILPGVAGGVADALLPGSGPAVGAITDLLVRQVADENGAGDVPLVGPGVPEPPNSMVKRRWETRVYDNELGYVKLNFYALTDGRIAMYHNYKKYWKVWRPKKNVVLSSNPRLKDLKKLDRVYTRMQRTVRKFAPKPKRQRPFYQAPYLSPIERKALKRGVS